MAKVDLKNAFRLCPGTGICLGFTGAPPILICSRPLPHCSGPCKSTSQWNTHSTTWMTTSSLPPSSRGHAYLILCTVRSTGFTQTRGVGPLYSAGHLVGIELDTCNLMQARLPKDRLAALLEKLQTFSLLPH